MRRKHVIGSVLFLWTILTPALVGAVPTPAPAPVECTERGWYFGLEYANGDSLTVAGHGPRSAWNRGVLVMPDSSRKFTLDINQMFDEHFPLVVVDIYRRLQVGDFEPAWILEATHPLRRRDFACQWTSEPDERGARLSFGNLIWLNSNAHRRHLGVETYETLESAWR